MIENRENTGIFSVRDIGGEQKVFILNDGDYTLSISKPAAIRNTDGLLVSSRDSDAMAYSVFSTIDGSQLLPYEYDDLQATREYLYAKRGDVWEVYAIHVSA